MPIVAWAHAVTAGNDPWIALRKFAPSPINRLRFGQASGHVCRTFHPPPSNTNVTTIFGVRAERAVESGNGRPWRSSVGNVCRPDQLRGGGGEVGERDALGAVARRHDAGPVDHHGDALEVHPQARVAGARVLRHQRERFVGVVRAVVGRHQHLDVARASGPVGAADELHVLRTQALGHRGLDRCGIGPGELSGEPADRRAGQREREPAHPDAHQEPSSAGIRRAVIGRGAVFAGDARVHPQADQEGDEARRQAEDQRTGGPDEEPDEAADGSEQHGSAGGTHGPVHVLKRR